MSSESVVAHFASVALALTNDPKAEQTLTSPARQTAFALSLLLTTRSPDSPVDLEKSTFHECVDLLNGIFGCYGRMYIQEGERSASSDRDKAQLVAMSAFTHYFHTGFVATTDQLGDRIRAYLTPHDAALRALLGITASTCLQICEHIANSGQAAMDRLLALSLEQRRLGRKLLERSKANDWPIERLREEASSGDLKGILLEIDAIESRLLHVKLSELASEFDHDANVFWKLFTVQRGSVPRIDYLTEALVYDRRPLIEVGDGDAICYAPNAIYSATIEVLEATLLASPLDRDRSSSLSRSDPAALAKTDPPRDRDLRG